MLEKPLIRKASPFRDIVKGDKVAKLDKGSFEDIQSGNIETIVKTSLGDYAIIHWDNLNRSGCLVKDIMINANITTLKKG